MATVVISVDAELGWGFHDKQRPPVDRVRASRRGWRRLVELLDRYEVPATWGIVGHLFLDSCDGVHADVPAPAGWFDHDGGPRGLDADLRFGRGLVEAIRQADVTHEIGSHTFSHVEFGDDRTTEAWAKAEVAACIDAQTNRGNVPTSFIFPRNNIGHRRVLAAHGFRCYRGLNPDPKGFLGKLLGATVGDPTPPLVTPAVDEFGLVDVPASLYLFSFEGVPRRLVERVDEDPVVTAARAGIDAAAASGNGRVFHMWLHPNNLVDTHDVERMRRVLSYLSRVRENRELRVQTMGEVADRVLAPREPERVEWNGPNWD